jgi:hypothetical protein
MMGQHDRSEALFYYFRLEDQVPENHLLRLRRPLRFCSASSMTVDEWAEDFLQSKGTTYDLNMLEGQNIAVLRFASEGILKLKASSR